MYIYTYIKCHLSLDTLSNPLCQIISIIILLYVIFFPTAFMSSLQYVTCCFLNRVSLHLLEYLLLLAIIKIELSEVGSQSCTKRSLEHILTLSHQNNIKPVSPRNHAYSLP